MDVQRRLLRVMLAMLAFAAAAGVLAVFISRDVMGRVAGTAILTAVVCALAMPVSRRLDDEKRRAGGLLGLGSLIAAFVLGAAAIWVDVVVRGWDISFRLAMTGLVAAVGGMIAAALLDRARGKLGGLAARFGLGVDFAAAALFLGAIWVEIGSFLGGGLSEKLGLSGSWVLMAGVPAGLALIGSGARDRAWRWAGVAASGLALVMAFAGIWVLDPKDPTLFIGVMTVAVVVGYANVVVRLALGGAGVWAKLIAVGSLAGTGACLVVMSFLTGGKTHMAPDALVRLAGAGGIVAACSTIGVLILYRLNRRTPGTSQNVAEIAFVQVACPHCGKKRSAAVGESACEGCGLVLILGVREPRCGACDYPLLGIKSGVCPECGEKRSFQN